MSRSSRPICAGRYRQSRCGRVRRTRRSTAGRCAAPSPRPSLPAVWCIGTNRRRWSCSAKASAERREKDKRAELREKALKDLQQSEVLMLNGHFDYGNGYHGRVYLNPHQLFRTPSTIWRFAQDLLDVLPSDLIQRTEVVAGPVTGGALLAHTMAGLLDSRRSLTHPPCSFAPFNDDGADGFALRRFYRGELQG